MSTWGMLRVKNEARWIEKAVRSIQPLCDRIFIWDDHSDDGTPEICEALGCNVFRAELTTIHEARDKDLLLAKVWEAGAQVGDHCIFIDGDEALYADDIQTVRDAITEGWHCCSLHIVYLWDREDQIRVDRWYKEFRRPSLFRLINRNLTFRRTVHGGNFHCSSAPAQLLNSIHAIKARLLHYGYLHQEDRIKKYQFYNTIDPNNALEDRYRHMVIGDLPEFPANSRFRWAGPLELKPLS